MTIFDALNLIGGLVLFLFGMNVMGNALEKRAGNRLKNILGSMTSNVFKGFMLGLGVTAIIQSSSATTVMVVGFVNSGLMTLKQAVGVIMGANLGTSVTSWLLSTTAIEGDSLIMQLLKPTSFTPVLALIGLYFYMFQKNAKRKDTGLIFIGFAVLMFGMDMMSDSVAGLQDVPQFRQVLTLFSNPILGVIVGTVFTAVIQSSSASVGILQALSTTGSVSVATAIPIIMGQNIGTCVSAMISSIGATKNAKRAAVIHLSFNIIATLIILPVYYLIISLVELPIISQAASPLGIAVVHTGFKIVALAILMPCSKLLEKLACKIVTDSKETSEVQLLDERLLATPSVAIERCRTVAISMAEIAVSSFKDSLHALWSCTDKVAEKVRADESQVDQYEDKLGTYLVKISSQDLTHDDSNEVNKLLHIIGDYERISDHAVNIIESAEEIRDKKLDFSEIAREELTNMMNAIEEILDLALTSFRDGDLTMAIRVEPLEQIVDYLRDYLKNQHINRLRQGECTIELGFVLSDLLTNLERVADHCSNVACCLIEIAHESMDVHEYIHQLKDGEHFDYNASYEYYKNKYAKV